MQVVTGDEVVRVVTPLAELALPRSWVDTDAAVWPLLKRQLATGDVREMSSELAAVVRFLDECGGIERLSPQREYTTGEIRRWFDAVILDWYAAYYAHPMWKALRAGTLDRGRLLAWVIHNYHVSRAAGISSARCAVRFPRADLREALQRDTLEEYWHCDAFYFVAHPRLAIESDAVKSSLPLPATLAVEHMALWMAENDWLGYLLFAYFQESSIRFLDDAQTFYTDVERHYELETFFESWMAHISIDVRHGHADILGKLLDADASFTAASAAHASIRNAWMAYRFLLASLDEIMDAPASDAPVPLRQSGTLDAVVPRQVRANDDAPFLVERGTAAYFRALSYATHHDEVMAFGSLAREGVACRDRMTGGAPGSLWATAVANALDALSVTPRALATVLLRTAEAARECGASWPAFDDATMERLRLIAADRVAADAELQFAEIYRAWVEEVPPEFDDGAVFSASQASTESAFASAIATG
ncbi:MAG TPA: hypothetical protein VM733_05020 [Thermoanaerobaculia bacterium]|nr:hypothetical protein [Thermoanaerobaculia bacterium]